MKNKNNAPLFIVQNANSTRANLIEDRVFGPLLESEIPYTVYETERADTEENITLMQEHIPAGATVISAAGDGTAMQLVNASIRAKKDWTLGFMPLGNFNDQATSRTEKAHTIHDLLHASEIPTRPLTIEVDGEYWRHAPAYMTLGWTALAASQFGSVESRQEMKDMPDLLKLGKSLIQLAGNYRQNRKTFLPSFEANGVRQERATDIIAANSPRIGNIVRSMDSYYDKSYFGVRADIDVSRILPNIPFGVQAISGHAPFARANELQIVFEKVAHVPVQTEGEFEWLDAKEIFVYKNANDAVKVLHPKPLVRTGR